MQYDKTIKDTEGDTARVAADPTDLVVELWTRQEIGPGSVYLALAPDAARRLARALKQAANVAEGKPAKEPKPPRVLVDGEGDKWDRVGRGLYTCRDHEYDCTVPEHHVRQTPDAIRERYGIREEIA